MAEKLTKKRHSLALKIIASVGVILFFFIFRVGHLSSSPKPGEGDVRYRTGL
jgi:hypothetical protein